MTEKSAEAPRTPESWLDELLNHLDWHPTRVTDEYDAALSVLRAALAARDAEWRKAVTETFGRLAIEMVMAGTAAHSGALRALLSEGNALAQEKK